MDTLPVWKRIYPVIALRNQHITLNVVEDVLDICREHITNVCLYYKCYTREGFNEWKQKLNLPEISSDDEMCNFIHNLSRELDLDTNVAWNVVCNFLMYEYYGKVDELKSLIKFDSKIEFLTENIWYFYTGDRMFLFKTLRHILEGVENQDHIYFKKIHSFANTLDISLLWKNLVQVFSNLINEIQRDKINMVSAEILQEWIHRNNREQIEVLLLLMETLQHLPLDGSELEQILTICLKHGFTRLPLHANSLKMSREQDLYEVRNAEIALLLAIMEKYWSMGAKIKIVMLPQNVERNLELLQIQGDICCIVLFAWTILKMCIPDHAYDLEQCNTVVEKLLEKKVFVSLLDLLIDKMFMNNKSGEIVVDVVYSMMVEFSKICVDLAQLHEQAGVSKIIAELLRRKGLIVLESFGPIFQLSLEAFPFVFEPFLEMCKSLLILPDKYENILKLLKNIPGFLAEMPWEDHRQKFILNQPQKLFIDSDLFVVPAGSTVEKFLYQGYEFARFLHPFSFFLLMEQFIKSLSTISFEVGPNWHCYKNLTKLVQIGFNFINYLLKHYQGDYRNDKELRTLVQRLEIIPAQFSDGPLKNFEFIRLYFATNCTLITKELLDYMEAFPPIQRKKFLPSIVAYDKENRNALFDQLHNQCLLFKTLKEEEGKGTHTLLVDYLKLINFMVKKNIYHQEVQLPGVWYVLNCTFPLYQQWVYEDPSEKIQIAKICFSIFVDILQMHLSKATNDLVIFELVIDSFLYEDIIMSSYMSALSKDKFYLQNIMEQESNWTNGQKLENIECLRLQLVLLLLLFKHKAKVNSKRSTLDDNVGFFAKAITPYIVNAYSLALRKLSCRFLELLSRDQNIPLMPLLGLDYDQVQRLYLDRLRDSTEDDDLKVHILDLIGTCVMYQHGMTAAFFNVKRSRKWYSDNKEKTIEIDTVSDFLIDYLHNVKKSPDFLRSPLQIGILHVMSNLWVSQKKHLINEVISLEEFWPLLSNPLYREFDQAPKVYAYIFKIYRIQLIEMENNTRVVESIDRFITDNKQVKVWIDYIWKTFNAEITSVEEVEDDLFMLAAWMEFLIVLEKNHELKKLSDLNKFQFISMTLDGITLPRVNAYCINRWMDLLLLQLSYWGIPNIKNAEFSTVVKKTLVTTKFIKSYYKDLDHSSRLSVLTIIQLILDNLRKHFETEAIDLLEILENFGPMYEYEYTIIMENQFSVNESDIIIREKILPWMLCIRIVNGLFDYNNVKDIGIWCTYRNLIEKLMDSTNKLLKDCKTVPLAKMSLHSLALYAKSPLHLDFLNINTNDFFIHVEPAITNLLYGQSNKINPLQLEEGWTICSLLIKFETNHVQSLQQLTIANFYNFITLNEQVFCHIFNILETTVALKALDLVINTLTLFESILLNWNIEWYRKSNATYNFVLNGVKKIVNACLYAILRPKNIIVYVLDDSNRFSQLEKFPVELMVAIMNRLVTVAGLGFSILYKTNANLVNLLDVSFSDTTMIIIENDFSVPKFELPISNKLTYGMLLCLSHFLCKTLDALNSGKLSSTSESTKPQEDQFSRYFGMVEHQYFTDNLPTQKLSAFLRYAMYEYSGLADPWIHKLDFSLVKYSLESLMVFLAQQIFLAVRTVESENVSYFKRNLSSELQFFYEHVKKTTSVLLSSIPSEKLSQICRNESDILKRYLLYFKENNSYSDVVDNNFCIIISYWFINLCKLR